MPPRRILQANAPYAYSPLLLSPDTVGHPNHHLALGLGLGCSLGVILVALVAALLVYHRLKTSRTNPYDLYTSKNLQKFSYRHLKRGTANFSEEQKLGQGGFGAVYKGRLRNGSEVAVKRIDVSSVQGSTERGHREGEDTV